MNLSTKLFDDRPDFGLSIVCKNNYDETSKVVFRRDDENIIISAVDKNSFIKDLFLVPVETYDGFDRDTKGTFIANLLDAAGTVLDEFADDHHGEIFVIAEEEKEKTIGYIVSYLDSAKFRDLEEIKKSSEKTLWFEPVGLIYNYEKSEIKLRCLEMITGIDFMISFDYAAYANRRYFTLSFSSRLIDQSYISAMIDVNDISTIVDLDDIVKREFKEFNILKIGFRPDIKFGRYRTFLDKIMVFLGKGKED